MIIFVSFVMLSGIITSIIGTYLSEEKEGELQRASTVISDQIERLGYAELGHFVNTTLADGIIMPVMNMKTDMNIMIADSDGRILLTTVGMRDGRRPITGDNIGSVSVSDFKLESVFEVDTLVYRGNFEGLLDERSIVMAKEIVVDGELCGYVLTLSSIEAEDKLITVTRRAVFNSSVWVMLAAVIATYFITERIIHPLRVMTGASKSFAKGDFSTRVTVYGNDEVSELANSFNNMAESLENLEKMRNSFLASVSHDLRTPMTTISGFIDGITSGAIPPEKHEYYLGVISSEVHRLSRLVSQILDVSRLESGDRKFTFTDFDIAEMARLVLISFEKKIEDKKLDVLFDAEFDGILVNADKDAIYQVIYNVCHNAIKFSREGGLFRIKIETQKDKRVRFSVYDEGATVPKDELNAIFDRFYKTDKSRGIDKNGVGLGLYISKTIIDAHGEKISATSDEYGTELSFTLKLAETHA